MKNEKNNQIPETKTGKPNVFNLGKGYTNLTKGNKKPRSLIHRSIERTISIINDSLLGQTIFHNPEQDIHPFNFESI